VNTIAASGGIAACVTILVPNAGPTPEKPLDHCQLVRAQSGQRRECDFQWAALVVTRLGPT
jgi:hypothetical protein